MESIITLEYQMPKEALLKEAEETAKYHFTEYYTQFREKNLKLTKTQMKTAVGRDQLLVQLASHWEEIEEIVNKTAKRFRELTGWYVPEMSREIRDHKRFAEEFIKKDMTTEGMGIKISENDLSYMKELGKELISLYGLLDTDRKYIEELMQEIAPNINAICGPVIGAQIILKAKGLPRLALMPSSTIQLLGAEKALFRHIKTGARSPKYGLLINHPYVVKAKEKGKAARMVADKISIASRVDYFKGTYIGDKLKEEMDKRKL